MDLEPLREAQEDLNVRLDAVLVELRHIRVLLEEVIGADTGSPALKGRRH
ncbi:MAG TPA: hypothetical protein VHL78_10915 [Actinomycetota bacterium]|nr:hypothetical protein [Actinomycetota bacterium]